MKNNSAFMDHEHFGKYFQFLSEGNAIAARLEHNIISQHTAKVLFRELVEKLADEIAMEQEKTIKK